MIEQSTPCTSNNATYSQLPVSSGVSPDCGDSVCCALSQGSFSGKRISVRNAQFSELKEKMRSNGLGALFVQELKYVADRICTQWPANEFLYVGIGRALSPLLAELESRFGKASVRTIPLSDFRPLKIAGKTRLKHGKVLSVRQIERLSAWFDRHLGKVESGKKILLMDYVWSGRTLFSATWYLNRYLKERINSDSEVLGESDKRVEALGLCDMYTDSITRYGASLISPVHEDDTKEVSLESPQGYGLGFSIEYGFAIWLSEYVDRAPISVVETGTLLPRNRFYDRFVEYLGCMDHDLTHEALVENWAITSPSSGSSGVERSKSPGKSP